MSAELALLLLWGTAVALDLVTVPQVMIARPLVAGTVAGAILGDLQAGAMAGAILELFALDLLPVGAARYPDYGPGAVAAAAVAVGAPDVFALGLAVALGLGLAYAGQWTTYFTRRLNARDMLRHRAPLDAGDAVAIRRIHLRSIARDAARGLLITAFGLGAAWWLRSAPPFTARGAVLLSSVAVGAGLAAATSGALRTAGTGPARVWFLAGLLAGAGWLVLQ